MRFNLKLIGVASTPDIRAYVEKRINSLDKFIDKNDRSVFADVEIGQTTRHHHSGPIFRAEINLHLAGRKLRAVAVGEDLYAAIDEMKDETHRELVSHKDKRVSLVRRGARQIKDLIRRIYPF